MQSRVWSQYSVLNEAGLDIVVELEPTDWDADVEAAPPSSEGFISRGGSLDERAAFKMIRLTVAVARQVLQACRWAAACLACGASAVWIVFSRGVQNPPREKRPKCAPRRPAGGRWAPTGPHGPP